MLIYIVFLFTQFQNVQTVNLEKKDTFINLDNIQNIKLNDHFYNKTTSTCNDRGDVITFDYGNNLVHIFRNGRHLLEFGKSGNGPMEFADFKKISATNDRILILSINRYQIFDLDGNYINSGKMEGIGFASVISEGDLFKLHFGKYRFPMYRKINIDNLGKLTNLEINPLKNVPQNQHNNQRIRTQGLLQQSNIVSMYFEGEYKLITYSNDMIPLKIYYRSFNRIKKGKPDYSNFINRSYSKEDIQRFVNQMTSSNDDGFENDIKEIIGIYGDFLFVRTSTKDFNHNNIDIIDMKNNTYDSILLDDEKINDVNLFGDKLIVNGKNDEIGPYVTIYKISLKHKI